MNLYSEEIKNIVYAKRKSYLEIEMENISITKFIQEYMGAALFVLIILFFGWVKEVFSFQMISNYVILMVFIFAPAYGVWKKDMKKAECESTRLFLAGALGRGKVL